MALQFHGGERLQRGRGIGGILRIAKSVFSPLLRTATRAATSSTGKAIGNALKEQALSSAVNLTTKALRGEDVRDGLMDELVAAREKAADTLVNVTTPKPKRKKVTINAKPKKVPAVKRGYSKYSKNKDLFS